MSVEVGFKNDPDLFFRAEMWRDELRTLQTMLSAKEDREGTDFKVINLSGRKYNDRNGVCGR